MNGIIAALMGVFASTQCQPVAWTQGPVIEGGMFKGTASIQCSYVGRGGGGFPQLESYLIERMKKQASKIYAGPIYSQTEGMPSTAYDFEMQLPFQGEQVVIRQDGYVATDDRTRVASAMVSKSIQGSGNAKYLKKFDIRFDVVPSPAAGSYGASVSAHIEIQKPGVVPGGLFKSQIQQAIEKAVTDEKDKVLSELESNT